MVDDTGKFDFRLLKSFAQKNSLETFVSEIPHAVLIGVGLYRGWFDNAAEIKKKNRNTETVLFLQSPKQKNIDCQAKNVGTKRLSIIGKSPALKTEKHN